MDNTQFLWKGCRRILDAFYEAILPEIPGEDNEKIRKNTIEDINAFLSGLTPFLRILYNLGIYLIQFGTILFAHSILPFTFLSKPSRIKYIKKWDKSIFAFRRNLILAYRSTAMLAFYSQKEVTKYLNYDIESHIKERMSWIKRVQS
jgi:hypothetical protein